MRDLVANTTLLVSRADGPTGAKGNEPSFEAAISADGRLVAFTSSATNLDPDDTDPTDDVCVRDLVANTTTLVSRASGAPGDKSNGFSFSPTIPANLYVAFASTASNLHPADTDTDMDVFVRDLAISTTTLVSRATGANGAKGDGESGAPTISASGRLVAFGSSATNLDSDDADTTEDVFVRDLQGNTTTLVSRAAGAAGVGGNGHSDDSAISADGRFVTFISRARTSTPTTSM